MKVIIGDEIVPSRPLEGPLAAHISGFVKWARDQGYARYSRYRQVLLAACFSRWLGQHPVKVCRVSAEHQARYLRSRARHVQVRSGDAAALEHFLDYLRSQGVVLREKAAPCRLTPIEKVVQAFECYIRNERALSEAAVVNYMPFVRNFLADQFGIGPVRLSRLRADDVVRFVRRAASRLHLKRAKLLTSALRSFLHYARYRGDIQHDLAAAVPTVANWSMTSIPRAIPADAVRRLLASINRHSSTGRRDHAFLLTASQTGLRLSEMTGLTRKDVTLSTGAHVRVIGKGRKERCVPLAKPTVAVLKAWLCEPPRGDGHVLFPNARGTRLTPDGVHYLLVRHVKTAATACPSLKGKRVTVHVLRHTMALDLLQGGVDRSVIALWLGHESVETTQIYLEATLAMKEKALSKTKPMNGQFRRYRPGDQLLGFLNSL